MKVKIDHFERAWFRVRNGMEKAASTVSIRMTPAGIVVEDRIKGVFGTLTLQTMLYYSDVEYAKVDPIQIILDRFEEQRESVLTKQTEWLNAKG